MPPPGLGHEIPMKSTRPLCGEPLARWRVGVRRMYSAWSVEFVQGVPQSCSIHRPTSRNRCTKPLIKCNEPPRFRRSSATLVDTSGFIEIDLLVGAPSDYGNEQACLIVLRVVGSNTLPPRRRKLSTMDERKLGRRQTLTWISGLDQRHRMPPPIWSASPRHRCKVPQKQPVVEGGRAHDEYGRAMAKPAFSASRVSGSSRQPHIGVSVYRQCGGGPRLYGGSRASSRKRNGIPSNDRRLREGKRQQDRRCIVPFAPLRQKIISAITSGVVPDLIKRDAARGGPAAGLGKPARRRHRRGRRRRSPKCCPIAAASGKLL